jgi:hypothetical protein
MNFSTTADFVVKSSAKNVQRPKWNFPRNLDMKDYNEFVLLAFLSLKEKLEDKVQFH